MSSSFHFLLFSLRDLLEQHQFLQVVSHGSLSNSKSPKVSRTLLSILADSNPPVVWMVSILLLISSSRSPPLRLLGTVWNTQVKIKNRCHAHVPWFFVFVFLQGQSICLSFRFLFIMIILLFWEFFTPAFADGFQLESEGQQVSSNLQDSSQYSGQSQHCCTLDGLHSSSYLQVLQFLYQSFGAYTEQANYNWYHRHFQVP